MKRKVSNSAVIVAVIMIGFTFCKDIYKIGVKDGKAVAVQQKSATPHSKTAVTAMQKAGK